MGSSVVLSLGLALGLCVACGSSDASGGGNAGGGPSSAAGASGAGHAGGAPSSNGGAGHAGGAPSSSGGAPPSTSTLPGDKLLNSLTDDEFAQLCQEFAADFAPNTPAGMDAVEAECRLTGIFFAALGGGQTDAAVQAACKSGYDQCVAAPTQSDPAQCTKPGASCTATVAEAEACFNDSIASFATLKDALPMCSALTVASLSDGSSSPTDDMTPPSCVAYQAKCPDAPVPGGSTDNN